MTWRWATRILIRVVQYTKSGYSVGIAKPKTRSIWSESYVISPLPGRPYDLRGIRTLPAFQVAQTFEWVIYTPFPGANKKRNLFPGNSAIVTRTLGDDENVTPPNWRIKKGLKNSCQPRKKCQHRCWTSSKGDFLPKQTNYAIFNYVPLNQKNRLWRY